MIQGGSSGGVRQILAVIEGAATSKSPCTELRESSGPAYSTTSPDLVDNANPSLHFRGVSLTEEILGGRHGAVSNSTSLTFDRSANTLDQSTNTPDQRWKGRDLSPERSDQCPKAPDQPPKTRDQSSDTHNQSPDTPVQSFDAPVQSSDAPVLVL